MAISRTESPVRGSTDARPGPPRGTPAVVHALEAAAATERLCARGLWAPGTGGTNAFGEEVRILGDGDPRRALDALAACEAVAAEGGRAAAILVLAALVDARRALVGLVERRRPVVIHAVVAAAGELATAASHADLHAIGDVGVGVLVARHAQDAADLTVIAHRAAEDAETPIVIVHDGWPASFARDRVVLPDAPLVRVAFEPAPAASSAPSDANLPPHRRAAARVPFALSSAMRAFERYSGRSVDPVEAVHVEGADVVLVASGAIAESARALVEDRRRRGDDTHPLGVVQMVMVRPFPGADLVKATGRARAIAVIERADAPLCQSNPLAVEVKAAFADALTWAPGYPGIGRIPTVFSACIDPARKEATPGEILAVVENVVQGEHGRRSFRIGRTGETGPDVLRPAAEHRVHPDDSFSLRWSGDPTLLLHLLVDLYGGHVRATPRHLGEGEELWDVTLAPSPVRAHHGALDLDLVVVQGTSTRSEANELEAIADLRDGGAIVVAAASNGDGAIPASVRSALRGRDAHVFAVSLDANLPHERAGLVCGAILRALPPKGFDRGQLLADAERSLRAALPNMSDGETRALLAALARGLDGTREIQSA